MGSATLDGAGSGPVVTVPASVTAELRRVGISNGYGQDGGGIWNWGTLALTDCAITNNRTNGQGGGIFNGGTAMLTLTACTVTNNRALYGGGISNPSSGTVRLERDSRVAGNQATNGGGGIFNQGTLTLSESVVTENIANDGGGISNLNSSSSFTLRNGSTVSANEAAVNGGGIQNFVGTVTLEDTSRVAGNRARTGGGIFTEGGAARVTLHGESIVTDNDASPDFADSGGGIFNSSSWGSGTVAFFDAGRVTENRPNDCTGTTCPG
jgi:predicted outer membrane repeat protein